MREKTDRSGGSIGGPHWPPPLCASHHHAGRRHTAKQNNQRTKAQVEWRWWRTAAWGRATRARRVRRAHAAASAPTARTISRLYQSLAAAVRYTTRAASVITSSFNFFNAPMCYVRWIRMTLTDEIMILSSCRQIGSTWRFEFKGARESWRRNQSELAGGGCNVVSASAALLILSATSSTG